MWKPARALRAEFGERRLSRVLAGVALRVAVLAGLCLLGTQFLIHWGALGRLGRKCRRNAAGRLPR